MIRRFPAFILAFFFFWPSWAFSLEPVEEAGQLLAAGKFSKSARMAEKILEKDPSNAKAGIILAESYNGDGKFQKAAKVYTDMIKNEPENMDLVFRLGIVYNNAEYHLNAAEAFKKVVEVQPGNMVAHHRLGVSYALGMDLSKAYDEYRILKKHDEKLAKDLLDYIQTNNR